MSFFVNEAVPVVAGFRQQVRFSIFTNRHLTFNRDEKKIFVRIETSRLTCIFIFDDDDAADHIKWFSDTECKLAFI